jgi:transglutaminase-like putative cysteine protease
MKKILFLFIILFSTPAFADITNPQLIDKMQVEIKEFGSIEVSGNVNNIQLNLSIPQEDIYQKIDSFEVSDSYGLCANTCSYKFVSDKFGNKVLSVNWKNPSKYIDFSVKSVVSVNRRYSTEKKIYIDFLKPTNLVQSTDPEIASIASKARGSDFEKVAYLSKWINENIRYNTVYSDVNIPAKDILRLKIGVCKEFSNLLVSFLRNLGYYSAVTVGYVHPGKIYTGENFLPHGWIEAYNDEGILSDPTWGEVGYLDATHIKFATFPDSSWTFSSIYSTGFGNFNVNLKDSNVSVKLLSSEENPLLSFNSNLIENDLWKGYVVLKTDISSDKCLLTKFDVRSCSSDEGEFLEKINKENTTYFCNKKSIYTIFKIPDLQKNIRYNCPIAVLVYGGEQESIPLRLSFAEQGYTQLTVDKTTVSSNEKIIAQASNSYIFTDNGDYGFDEIEIFSSYYDFNVYSYDKGGLSQQRITVVSNKPLEASLIINDTAYAGKELLISVNVKNLVNYSQMITVKFKEQIQREYIQDSENFSFNFTPNSKDDNLIQVVVSTSDFSTSLSKQITVTEEKSSIDVVTNFFEAFFKAISDFFNWLISLFR